MPSYVEPFAGFSPKKVPAYTPAKPSRRANETETGFARAVLAAESLQRQGISIDPDTLAQETWGLDPAGAAELLGSTRFAAALDERGISLHAMQDLSPRQAAAIAIYLDMTTTATHAQKLKAAGVTDSTWRGWMRQPKFSAYLSNVSEEILAASIPTAKQRIAQGVDAGDIKFIDLALRMTGNNPDADVNVHATLMAIFEILDREVDQVTLRRIADQVGAMMNGAQSAALRNAMPASTQQTSGAVSSAPERASYVLTPSTAAPAADPEE